MLRLASCQIPIDRWMLVRQDQARSPFRAIRRPDFVRMVWHCCHRERQLPEWLINLQRRDFHVGPTMLGSVGTANRLKGVRDLIGVGNPALNQGSAFERWHRLLHSPVAARGERLHRLLRECHRTFSPRSPTPLRRTPPSADSPGKPHRIECRATRRQLRTQHREVVIWERSDPSAATAPSASAAWLCSLPQLFQAARCP